jgi:hypothetical protein
METIGQQKLWTFLSSSPEAQSAKCADVRRDGGHGVRSFIELATKVAELQFRNRDYVLLYRGQTADHRNSKGNTSLKPSIFRSGAHNPSRQTLHARFALLQRAEQHLITLYIQSGFLGKERLQRLRLIRWSILQHYGVSPTPLLDVTHSLRIAASFATHCATADSFIFVLGVPYLGGGLTASSESGLQAVRLSSVCPPAAVRPHIQEGYLLGEYPEVSGLDQQALYAHYEIDFGRRLVAKFRFNPGSFWRDDSFPLIKESALYPSKAQDPLLRLAVDVQELMQLDP